MLGSKRGQISTEYLIIVGFVTFLIISVLGLSLFYSGQVRDRIRFNQLNDFANKVISSSEVVFFSGEPSRNTITAYLPSGVESVIVLPNEIVFNVSSFGGLTVTSFQSDAPLYGSFSNTEGVKKVSIVANLSNVILGEV
jgi:uncharacterized protein (UPF0333 family)